MLGRSKRPRVGSLRRAFVYLVNDSDQPPATYSAHDEILSGAAMRLPAKEDPSAIRRSATRAGVICHEHLDLSARVNSWGCVDQVYVTEIVLATRSALADCMSERPTR